MTSPGKSNAKWPVPAQMPPLPVLQEIAEQKFSQITSPAQKESRPLEIPLADRAQIQRQEPVDDQPRANRKCRATIRNPNSAAREILRTRHKTEIAACRRVAAVTMRNKLLLKTNRMDRAGKVKLREIIPQPASARVPANRRAQEIIHRASRTILPHATAEARVAVIGCGNWRSSWAHRMEAATADRSREIIM